MLSWANVRPETSLQNFLPKFSSTSFFSCSSCLWNIFCSLLQIFFFPEGTFFYSVLISPLAFCLFTTTFFSLLVVHSGGGDYLYSSLSHPHILKCYEKGENVVPPLLAAFNVTICLVDVEAWAHRICKDPKTCSSQLNPYDFLTICL